MARKKKQPESKSVNKAEPFTPARIVSQKLRSPVIPTGDPRHMTWVRDGKFSWDKFTRKPERRSELGLPPLPTMESDFIDELRQ